LPHSTHSLHGLVTSASSCLLNIFLHPISATSPCRRLRLEGHQACLASIACGASDILQTAPLYTMLGLRCGMMKRQPRCTRKGESRHSGVAEHSTLAGEQRGRVTCTLLVGDRTRKRKAEEQVTQTCERQPRYLQHRACLVHCKNRWTPLDNIAPSLRLWCLRALFCTRHLTHEDEQRYAHGRYLPRAHLIYGGHSKTREVA